MLYPKVVTKGNENVAIGDGDCGYHRSERKTSPEFLTKASEDLMATRMPITKENLPYGNKSAHCHYCKLWDKRRIGNLSISYIEDDGKWWQSANHQFDIPVQFKLCPICGKELK